MSPGDAGKTGDGAPSPEDTAKYQDSHLSRAAGGASAGQQTILLMDDEESILEAYGRLLELKGYKVLTARNGSEALDLYKSTFSAGQTVDVVVIDLNIPHGMGGIETINRLKKIDPGVRAIVSSGQSGDPVLTTYEKFGFVGAIPKPYSWKDLLSAIERITTKRR